jgi:hypothetical protein
MILDRAGYAAGYFGAHHHPVLQLIACVSVGAVWCAACETANAFPAPLGVISPDGRVGTVAGAACYQCGDLWTAPGAEPVYTGRLTDAVADPDRGTEIPGR